MGYEWNLSGAELYNGNAPVTWTDLDLKVDSGASPTGVPSARVFAVLSVQFTATATYVSLRPNGDTDDYYYDTNIDAGASGAKPNSSGPYTARLVIVSDTSGVIEWQASGANNCVVKLVGWAELSYSGNQIATGQLAVKWTKRDLDSIVGVNYALGLFKLKITSGLGVKAAFRPNGDSENYESSTVGGPNQADLYTVGKSTLTLTATDENGDVEYGCSGTPRPNCDINLLSYEPGDENGGYYPSNTWLYGPFAAPTSWTNLANLPAAVQNRKALCFIKVSRDATGVGTPRKYGFRADGDTDDYLDPTISEPYGAGSCALDGSEAQIIVVETDSSGAAEWKCSGGTNVTELTLLGYLSENSPPSFLAQTPTSNTENPQTNIFVIISDDTGVDSSKIQLTITDPDSVVHNVIVNGVFQSPYSGTIVANALNGYNITVSSHPYFTIGTYTVDVTAWDDDGKEATDSWTFTVVRSSILSQFSSVPTAPFYYGADLWCESDLDPRMIEVSESALVLAQYCVRRLDTPNGLPDDDEWGISISDYLNLPTTTRQLSDIEGAIRAELILDDRIDEINVSVLFSADYSQITVNLRIKPVDPLVNEFTLILSVTDVGIILEEMRTQ